MTDIMKYAPGAYNSLEQYYEDRELPRNHYRTMEFAQPRDLQPGEELSNGWKIYQRPRATEYGISLLFQDDRPERYISPRLPLQLKAFRPSDSPDEPLVKLTGVLPQDLQVGDILQTGCVVVAPSEPAAPSRRPNGQTEVVINLSGGQAVQGTGVPDDIELAVFGTIKDLQGADDLLTRIVSEKLSHMRPKVLYSLTDHALFLDMIKLGRPE